MSQKWPPTIPKDAARLGDLGKRVFGQNFQVVQRKSLDFHFLLFGVSRWGDAFSKATLTLAEVGVYVCGVMCLSRLFTTEGPAYFDRGTIIQIVFAHPMIHGSPPAPIGVASRAKHVGSYETGSDGAGEQPSGPDETLRARRAAMCTREAIHALSCVGTNILCCRRK